MNFLDKIVRRKRQELLRRKARQPLKRLRERVEAARKVDRRDFIGAIKSSPRIPAFICELKRASPSKGWLCRDLDLPKAAKVYEQEGAACISVLTDTGFGGKLSDLRAVRKSSGLPLLRKDFILEEYQIYESVLAGADAVLLIAALLSASRLRELIIHAARVGLQMLVEVHCQEELEKIDFRSVRLLGINNRNLSDFRTDLAVTEMIMKSIPADTVVVSESGISSRKDVLRLKRAGARALLVGETLVSAPDIAGRIRSLQGRKI